MYCFIFGFQRLVWWPKCTPASRSSFIVICTKLPPWTRWGHTPRSDRPHAGLPLAELEALPRASQPIFLPFFDPRVAREQPSLFQPWAKALGRSLAAPAAIPSRSAPACPENPPPVAVANTSNFWVASQRTRGSVMRVRSESVGKRASSDMPLILTAPVPGLKKTRAGRCLSPSRRVIIHCHAQFTS